MVHGRQLRRRRRLGSSTFALPSGLVAGAAAVGRRAATGEGGQGEQGERGKGSKEKGEGEQGERARGAKGARRENGLCCPGSSSPAS